MPRKGCLIFHFVPVAVLQGLGRKNRFRQVYTTSRVYLCHIQHVDLSVGPAAACEELSDREISQQTMLELSFLAKCCHWRVSGGTQQIHYWNLDIPSGTILESTVTASFCHHQLAILLGFNRFPSVMCWRIGIIFTSHKGLPFFRIVVWDFTCGVCSVTCAQTWDLLFQVPPEKTR